MNWKNRFLSKSISCVLSAALIFVVACGSGKAPDPPAEAEGALADQNVGERIFIDTRFAQYFAANMTGVNDPLAVGDPVVSQVSTPVGVLPGPFAGQSINCRSCHFVTEFTDVRRFCGAQPDSTAVKRVSTDATKRNADGWVLPASQRPNIPAF